MSHAERFHAPPGPYFLNHSVGLQPKVAQLQADEAHFAAWAADPEHVWDEWLAAVEGFRRALAALFHHDAASFCPQQNVTSGLTKVLGALPRRSGRTKVLLAERAFPSLGFAVDRSVYDIEFVPADTDPTDVDTWRPLLTGDVAIVLITHAHSNTGELMPVRSIVELAAEREIFSVVDIAQSAGVIPIDLAVWNASFVVGSCVKWLCGGPGAGFLWGRPDVIEKCKPVDTGWFSHVDPFEFDIHHFVDAPDALRFWGGTPSVLPAAVATRSIELLDEIGIDVIRQRNLDLVGQIIEALPSEMVVSPVEPERRNGTVVVDPGIATDALVARLASARIAVDRRNAGLRISPHVYTSAADVEALLEQFVR